jgi:DNA-binding SARP family transcriptional activator
MNNVQDFATQAALNDVIERISQLERDLMELRQFVLVRLPCSEQLVDTLPCAPTRSPTSPPVGAAFGHWEVTFLGHFQLRCAGREPQPCTSRRGLAVLKYLLASSRYTATAEALIECFWPEADPKAGMHNLQMAIHALRRSLRGCGPDGSDATILCRNERYFINPMLSIQRDVDRFRDAYERGRRAASAGRMTEALDAFEEARRHYTGDYLADSPYEEWAISYRTAFQDMRFSLLSRLGLLYSQTGEWDHAASCYREILAIDSYREDAYRQLMRCQAAMGCLADVQRTYQACQERLRQDLRVAPASETTLLYKKLVRQAVQ